MSANESAIQEHIEKNPDYSIIVQSSSFQQLLREKRNFIIPWAIFFFIFYFTLPILNAYSSVLNKMVFGSISWAWIFGIAQFIMTWVLSSLYIGRSSRLDQTVETFKQSFSKEGA